MVKQFTFVGNAQSRLESKVEARMAIANKKISKHLAKSPEMESRLMDKLDAIQAGFDK